MRTARGNVGWLTFIFGFGLPITTSAQVLPPPAYYSSVTNASGSALKSALHSIIKDHTLVSYSADTAALGVVDADPQNSNNVILVYSGYSLAANTYPLWNKEHLWLEECGAGSGTPQADLFNLRACDANVNGTRGIKYYDVSTPPIVYVIDAPGSSYDDDSWEPRDGDKGFVARACFYMTTRYDGTGGDDNLELGEVLDANTLTFARLSTLLDWNRRFPPTDWERRRNGLIYQNYQHNRNPYIDNPDFADRVFLGVDGFTAWKNTHFSSAELANPAISATIAAPAGDGIPNLAKYALGHDPHIADPSTIQSLTAQVVDGTNYVYVSHHLNHYLSDVTLTYETSTNLTSWDEATAELVSQTQIDPQKDLVTVRFPAAQQSEFVRLKIHWLASESPAPLIVASGSTLASENCTPANGVVDPNETVTLNFSLRNFGSADTTNLVATLVATNGVTSLSGSQTYGVVVAGGPAVSRPFTFTATGACGSHISAMLQLQDGPTNLNPIVYDLALGQSAAPLVEGFDEVTPPALPAVWATAASGAQSNWIVSAASADTAPNAAYSPDPGGAGVNELDTPAFFIGSAAARLTFQQSFSLPVSATNSSLAYDGGVLEISIGGGPYQDIVTAGGSFVSGGYNATLSGDYENPLGGRQAWSGNSAGFLTTTITLPAATAGQNVQLRWRCASGNPPPPISSSGTLAFWGFDASSPTPDLTAPNVLASTVTTTNAGASPTFTGGNPSTGKAISGNGFTNAAGPPTVSYSCFAFTIAAASGFEVNLSNLSFDDRASGTGPATNDVQISRQPDFSSVIYDSGERVTHATFTSTPMNVYGLSNSNLTGTVYFRIYAYGAGSSSGTWRLDNMNVQGGVTETGSGGGDGWYIDSITIEDAVCCQ